MELTGASAGVPHGERLQLVEVIRNSSSPLEPVETGIERRSAVLSDVSVVLFDVYGTLFVSGSGDVGTAKTRHRDDHFAEAVVAATGMSVGRDAAVGIRESYFRAIESDHRDAHRRGIEHPEVDIAAVWERVLGENALTIGLEAVPPSLVRRVAVEYEIRANPVWPMPNARRLLEVLRNSRLAAGIVSNAQFFTPLLFDALLGMSPQELGMRDDLSAWSYRLGVAKPAPEMFANAVRGLPVGRSSQNVLYVGNDMLNDVWTANQVGFRTCLFAGDARSLRLRETRPECRSLAPDLVITRLEQLIRCVPGLRGDV